MNKIDSNVSKVPNPLWATTHSFFSAWIFDVINPDSSCRAIIAQYKNKCFYYKDSWHQKTCDGFLLNMVVAHVV